MNKKLIRLLLVFITLFTITLSVHALDPNAYVTSENNNEKTEVTQQEEKENVVIIEDDADVLTYEEESQLKIKMETLKTEGNVIFKSITTNDKTTKEYATEYYENKYNQQSGVLVLFDFGNGNMYLFTRGDVGKKFTSDQAQEIIDAAVPLTKEEKYYDGAYTIFSKLEEVLGLTKTVTEEKYGNTLLIEDDAHLLTVDEIEKLKERMDPLRKYGHIVFKTVPEGGNSFSSTKEFANNYYYSKFDNESGTIFIIDMDERMIYIVSAGENYKYITDSKADIITDNIYKYASNKDYYSCADKAFEQIGIVLDGGKIAEPMRHISNVVIAIVLAFFFNFFIVLSASKVKKATPNEVLKNCDIEFTAGNVRGVKSGTHSVYSPPSSSSSGGSSGGGGGGGGGFSGGGGGHSF